jgi:hypothetical protein
MSKGERIRSKISVALNSFRLDAETFTQFACLNDIPGVRRAGCVARVGKMKIRTFTKI